MRVLFSGLAAAAMARTRTQAELSPPADKKTPWTLYAMGCFAGAIPWIVMGISMSATSASPGSVPTPDYVYADFIILLLFYSSFALVFVLSLTRSGAWEDYVFTEYSYIFLSAISKTLIGWMTFVGGQ
jgi:hypothetical protein